MYLNVNNFNSDILFVYPLLYANVLEFPCGPCVALKVLQMCANGIIGYQAAIPYLFGNQINGSAGLGPQ